MEIIIKQIHIEKETAFQLLDCRKDSPIYEEMEASYQNMLTDIENLMKPQVLLEFAKAPVIFEGNDYPKNTEFAMILYTIGGEISDKIAGLFEEGEYLEGMLLDAMADSCLFSMEKEWSKVLQEECRKRKKGIAKRMEAPTDFSMDVQKKVWQLLNGEKIGVSMTSGLMFSPVKTLCVLFLLSDDICQNNVGHDCSRCANVNCKLRNEKR